MRDYEQSHCIVLLYLIHYVEHQLLNNATLDPDGKDEMKHNLHESE